MLLFAITMHAETDQDLLDNFRARGEEASFRILTERYTALVFHMAHRQTVDREMAQEITQNVFTILARKARRGMTIRARLSSWLCRVTINQSRLAIRTESNRRRKMEDFEKMQSIQSNNVPTSETLAPQLDEALNKLATIDRSILMMRYFEDLSFGEISHALGKSEDASRKQTSRALERLSKLMTRRGLTTSVATAATMLAEHYSEAAPDGMAYRVSEIAVASAVRPSLVSVTFGLGQSAGPLAALAMISIGAAIPLCIQQGFATEESAGTTSAVISSHSLRSRSVLESANRNPNRAISEIDMRWLESEFS
ncbi:MAG: RNA polymerase sigma factor (sigma-70 family) [Verrucomicrobiales bacterium]